MSQYDRCSSNPACHCLQIAGDTDGTGICVMDQLVFSDLVSCQPPHNWCYEPGDICVQTPHYRDFPVCFPKSEIDPRICPPIAGQTNQSSPYKKWQENAVTVAGGNGRGSQLNQLSDPQGFYIDVNTQSIYISDRGNDRIVAWKYGAKYGKVVSGGNGAGIRFDQLNAPRDVLVDQMNDSLIICDRGNRRVVQWSRRNSTHGQTIIADIDCWYMTMDKPGDLYVSDGVKNEVRRWKRGETSGSIVAGGNGGGNGLNQFDIPTYIFVDEHQSLYVSDENNHRVMKWVHGAKEGIVVAGGQGEGNSLLQLSHPHGMTVDQWGDVFVSDTGNDRIVRWSKGSKIGHLVAGGNGKGEQANQLIGPRGLSFDEQGNLYIVDMNNHRVQKFLLDNH